MIIGLGSAFFVIYLLCSHEKIQQVQHALVIMISDSTIDAIRRFAADRDWNQFHTPGNLAKSINIEAAELSECFQWSDEPRDGNLEHVHEEIADVLIYCIMLSDKIWIRSRQNHH